MRTSNIPALKILVFLGDAVLPIYSFFEMHVPADNQSCVRRDSAMGLTLDPQLIRDLTVLITSSTVGGMVLEALKQPVINGFFIAGSVVGPGGLKLIKVSPSSAHAGRLAACLWPCTIHIHSKDVSQYHCSPQHILLGMVLTLGI